MVNRNEYGVSGPEIEIVGRPGMHYYDLWHGTELTPALANGKAALSFDLEGLGYGAVLATEEQKPDGSVQKLLSYMAERAKRPLASYSREWKAVPQTLVEVPATRTAQSPPDGMVRIPGGDYDFQVSGIEIEGGNDPGADVQYPWEDTARRFHRHHMHVHSFYLDRTPVTNAEFSRFLNSTHYHRRTITTFCALGRMAPIRKVGIISPSPGFRSRMPAPMRPGARNDFPMNGSGNMRLSLPTDVHTLGGTTGTPRLSASRFGIPYASTCGRSRFPEGRESIRRS